MSESVVLPALGESVTEGTVTRWLKNVGDSVEVDEPLLEVSTDKVDTEIPSPIAGVLEEILVGEDETVEVGAVLAQVGDGSGASISGDQSAGSQSADASHSEEPAASETSETPAQPVETSQNVGAPAAENDAAETASGGDSSDIVLPALGESVTEGTVTRWLKNIGDVVEVDDPILEVSTDKVDTEVPSPIAGTLQEILVKEDETVEVGAVLARVGSGQTSKPQEAGVPTEAQSAPEVRAEATSTTNGSESTEDQASEPSAPASPKAATETVSNHQETAPEPDKTPQPEAAPAASDPTHDRVSGASHSAYITPIVRKLANDQGVDLDQVTGSGVGGRIRKEDVLKAASATSSAPETSAADEAQPTALVAVETSPLRGTTQKMSRLRKVISERAVQSLQSTAQLTTMVEVDVTRVATLRQAKKEEFLEKTGSKLSFLPFFVLAAAEALRSFPIINATVEDDTVVYPATENISIAVDTERGLLTPVLREASEKNLAEIADEIADLAARTRDNKLKPDELSGGTFTVTNTGSRGALFDTPLVFLPQVAILGTGSVVKKPVVVSGPDGDAIAIHSTVFLALSYDHRIVDGADAARFLTQVKERLESGKFEANLGM